MNDTTKPSTTGVKLLLCVLVAVTVAFHLGAARHGHGLFRDIHLGTALHYAQTKIDLADTVIVGFNATGTPTIQELPVWQMAAGLAFKVFGPWWGWANVVSLALFLPCLYPLFKLARIYLDERAAYWTLVFFLAQPLVFVQAGEASTDGFCLAVMVWFLYCAVKLVREPGWKWFLPACGFAALAAVSKVPFFMAAGLAAFFLLLKEHGFCVKRILLLGGAGGFAVAVFLAWTHYTDSVQTGAVLPFVDLRVSHSPDIVFWFFGDLKYRLSAGNWARGGWRVLTAVFGSFAMAALAVVAWRNRGGHPVARCLCWGALLTTLVFCHLVLHHWHYYLMLAPAAALLCAEGWTLVETKFPGAARGIFSPAPLAALLILLSLAQGLMGMKALTFDNYPARMADIIRQHTAETDKLVVVGGGWGGEEMFRSGRQGLSAWDAHLFDSPENFAKMKALGYDKLVVISESPFQDAMQRVTPGQANRQRELWRDHLTPAVESWPTVFQSDDLLIKDIP